MNFSNDNIRLVGYTVSPGAIGPSGQVPDTFELIIDNAMNQGFNFQNVLTQHPTTRGTPITDNIYRLPQTCQIDGILSASTVNSTFNINNIIDHFGYLSTKYNTAQQAALNTYIFQVYTGITVIESMGIVSLSLQRDTEIANCIRISVVLQELLTVPFQNSSTKNNENRPPSTQGNQNG